MWKVTGREIIICLIDIDENAEMLRDGWQKAGLEEVKYAKAIDVDENRVRQW